MYNIITSKGVVLKKYHVGESHVVVNILTENHGVLRAHVRSARCEQSKLRYGIESLTVARFSFVRGKQQWRLIGTEDIHPFSACAYARTAAGRIALLLLRLIDGEVAVQMVYATVTEGLQSLEYAELATIPPIEWVLVLRILAHLGYVSAPGEVSTLLIDNLFSEQTLRTAKESRRMLIRMINTSLKASDL